jgi:hypothetical protein
MTTLEELNKAAVARAESAEARAEKAEAELAKARALIEQLSRKAISNLPVDTDGGLDG